MADEKQLNEDELFTFVEYSPEAHWLFGLFLLEIRI